MQNKQQVSGDETKAGKSFARFFKSFAFQNGLRVILNHYAKTSFTSQLRNHPGFLANVFFCSQKGIYAIVPDPKTHHRFPPFILRPVHESRIKGNKNYVPTVDLESPRDVLLVWSLFADRATMREIEMVGNCDRR